MTEQQMAARLAQIMGEVGPIQKKGKITSQGSGPSYKFARDADVMEAVTPKMAEAGIVMVPEHTELLSVNPTMSGKQMVASIKTGWLVTDGKDSLRFETFGQGADTGDKALPKAQSNARKYAFFMLYHIVTDDDPDHFASEPARSIEQPSQAARGREAGSAVPADSTPATAELTSEQIEARYAFGERHGFSREQFEEEVARVCKGQALWDLVPEDWRIFADLVKVGEVKPPNEVSAETQKRLDRAKELAEETRKHRDVQPEPEPLTLGVDK